MSVEIREIDSADLALYAEVPIRFVARSVYRVENATGATPGLMLVEEPLAEPYEKDYDAMKGEGPMRWARSFDLTNWGFLLAVDGEVPVGGAVIAFRTPGVRMLGGREDLAVLWDLRVHPDRRGNGIGSLLFSRSVEWARERGATQLKVETQNVNVPACRFYASRGCALGGIERHAYAASPACREEVLLLWFLDL